jgi:predicted enzyme related to lactoylglutathione lyase
MLKDSRAFSSFSVKDTKITKEFYGSTLGLDISDVPEMEGLLQMKLAGGTEVMIYPKTDHIPASFTVLNFPVKNVEETVDKLIEKGISIERYDTPEMKSDSKGIYREGEVTVAWFKDPSGNILSIVDDK